MQRQHKDIQQQHTQINETAWNQLAYEAWTYRFGQPFEAANKIKKDPTVKLGALYKYFDDVKDKKIGNLLGSHGTKAVSLALLGAKVTVIDFSWENSRYALELAREAGVNIKYIISDVLNISPKEITGDYDIVFSELGILHYFTDLNPFFNVFSKLLHKDGLLIIQDFHPISTKLITTKGKKHKVTGNYFDNSIEETDVAYMKFVPGIDDLKGNEKNAFQKAHLRKWTLGEIITAIANQGFCIKILEESENPNPKDKGIPKLFTVVAKKI